jgi:hypothetical protein
VTFQVLKAAAMKTATLMMEALNTPEVSVNFYKISRCNIPEDVSLQQVLVKPRWTNIQVVA